MLSRRLDGLAITQQWQPLAGIAPALVQAVIAAEDSRFCTHAGFDFDAIAAAWRTNSAAAGRLRGASTLSQQTAKNAFLWPGRDWLRKGLEAYFTLLIESLWSKRRILEVYLNIAEWGEGVFGAEAAAQRHFGKPAAALSAREAALMAAALPNPRGWSPARPGGYLKKRARVIQQRARIVALGRLAACLD